jgi:hypothetical protein
VCVAVPWHPDQYVFPEASTLLTCIFFYRFMCLLSTGILRWSMEIGSFIYAAQNAYPGGIQKDNQRLEDHPIMYKPSIEDSYALETR